MDRSGGRMLSRRVQTLSSIRKMNHRYAMRHASRCLLGRRPYSPYVGRVVRVWLGGGRGSFRPRPVTCVSMTGAVHGKTARITSQLSSYRMGAMTLRPRPSLLGGESGWTARTAASDAIPWFAAPSGERMKPSSRSRWVMKATVHQLPVSIGPASIRANHERLKP